MQLHPTGSIAVIFCALRTNEDEDGYQKAVQAMDELAARQPGYLGIDTTRGDDGFGITVSYWKDDDAAKAWRDHPDHRAIREQGRGKWYASFTLHVARVEHSYDWEKSGIGKNSVA